MNEWRPPLPDKPGFRHCGKGSGSWDNAVRVIEEGVC